MRLCEEHRLGGISGVEDDKCVGCAIDASRQLLRACQADTWEDVDDEWSESIKRAHPTRSGSHDAYSVAMKMVGHRHSKGELVSLVNWLLLRISRADDELVGLQNDLANNPDRKLPRTRVEWDASLQDVRACLAK
jgi:hypothetical protein